MMKDHKNDEVPAKIFGLLNKNKAQRAEEERKKRK